MSLATRCPVCSTVFRVVQDQLKVSEGWVRCGRCAKVFNAFEGLFDLERELATMAAPAVTPAQQVLDDLARRNRNPKPRTEWTGEEFPDTGAAVRVGPPPAPAEPTRAWPRPSGDAGPTTASGAPSGMGLPAWAASRPASLAEHASTTAPGALGSAARTAAPAAAAARMSGAASRPAPAWPAPAWPTPAAEAPAALAAAAGATAAPTLAATAPEAAVVDAASPAEAVALRQEPAPMADAVADSGASEGSYESMFRSTGELDPDTAHPSGIDIVLDSDEARGATADAPDSQYLSFVQKADRAARWRRPGVRVGLAVAATVLTLLLAVQFALADRDQMVLRWPAAKPLLSALCDTLGCRIEPLRRIERLAVESSGLTRIGEGQVYRLAMVLHNRGELPLMIPAVDLTLTDSGGALVSRRVLMPPELGATGTTIAAGQEMPLQVLLRSNDRPVTGYTIEIFYP
ncbi:MAG: zinc-ribbon and DUF3426 domain-containing protein [Burkholderiaceae bacterium]